MEGVAAFRVKSELALILKRLSGAVALPFIYVLLFLGDKKRFK